MFFDDCKTPQEIKNKYRKLCFKHHPDIGGDLETMKQVNIAYHAALKNCHGHTATGSDGKDHTYYYKQAVEQEVMDKIAEILKVAANQGKGWTIELIGTWIWVSGTKKADKALLNKNGLGLKWHGKREMWYFRRYGYRRKMSHWSTDEMREAYGSQAFKAPPRAKAVQLPA